MSEIEIKKVYIVVCHDYEEERDVNQRAFLSEDAAYANLVEQLQKYDRARYDFHIEEVVIADWPDKSIKDEYSRNVLSTSIQDLKEYAEKYMADELKEKYAASKEMVQDDVDYCVHNIVRSYLDTLEDIRNTYLSQRDTSWMK